MNKKEHLARFSKAMGHPTRITILIFWLRRMNVSLAAFTKSFLSQRLLYIDVIFYARRTR